MNRARRSEHAEDLAVEARLVQQAKSGDAGAFGQLYDASVDRVYRYVFYRVTDEQTAEDLTSQVFLKAWENLYRYQPIGPFAAWLYSIARNAVIDHYRTSKRTVALEEVEATLGEDARLDETVDLNAEAKSLREAMQYLTDEQREVLTLKFISGMDTSEISSRMRKSEGAIRALQMRALQALGRVMETDER